MAFIVGLLSLPKLLTDSSASMGESFMLATSGEKVEVDSNLEKYLELNQVSIYFYEPDLNAKIIKEKLSFENVKISNKYYDYIEIHEYIKQNGVIIPILYNAIENDPSSEYKMNIYYSYREVIYSEDVIKVYPDTNEIVAVKTTSQYRAGSIKTPITFTLTSTNPIKVNADENFNNLMSNVGSNYFLINNTLYVVRSDGGYEHRDGGVLKRIEGEMENERESK